MRHWCRGCILGGQYVYAYEYVEDFTHDFLDFVYMQKNYLIFILNKILKPSHMGYTKQTIQPPLNKIVTRPLLGTVHGSFH